MKCEPTCSYLSVFQVLQPSIHDLLHPQHLRPKDIASIVDAPTHICQALANVSFEGIHSPAQALFRSTDLPHCSHNRQERSREAYQRSR